MPASAGSPVVVGEAPPPAACLAPPHTARPPTEEELVRLWQGQHLPADALTTRRGQPLRVVYRGRPSPGPGPDFRDVIIEGPAGELWQGDLEVHVRASGFRLHGHDRDTAYDSVVLHLVWEDDVGEDTPLSCGRRAAVVALASWFQRRRQELARLLTRSDDWREPCFTALARLGTEAVGRTIDRLGDLRFRQKTEVFRRALRAADLPDRQAGLPPATAVAAADQLLYAAVLEALGYGGHRETYARLARELPYDRLMAAAAGRPLAEAAARLETMLLTAAGLAAPGGSAPWRPRCWRPANDPRRRLAGAARLLARAGPSVADYACHRLPADPSPTAAVRAWTVPAEGAAAPALVGRGRAIEILVNAVLPFLAAGGGTEDGLRERAVGLFHRLPAPGRYGATAHLEQALALEGRRRLTGSARRQQGLLYLLHRYCRQGGCAQTGAPCPLSGPGDRNQEPGTGTQGTPVVPGSQFLVPAKRVAGRPQAMGRAASTSRSRPDTSPRWRRK